MFATDRSWLVSTMWDDDWTCVGGSRELVDSFLATRICDTESVRLITSAEDRDSAWTQPSDRGRRRKSARAAPGETSAADSDGTPTRRLSEFPGQTERGETPTRERSVLGGFIRTRRPEISEHDAVRAVVLRAAQQTLSSATRRAVARAVGITREEKRQGTALDHVGELRAAAVAATWTCSATYGRAAVRHARRRRNVCVRDRLRRL